MSNKEVSSQGQENVSKFPKKGETGYRIARYLAPVKTWKWAIEHPELTSFLTP